MLPVCSATTSCSAHSQISIHGVPSISSNYTASKIRCNIMDRLVPDFSNRAHQSGVCLEKMSTNVFYSNPLENSGHSGFMDIMNERFFQKELDYPQFELLHNGSYPTMTIDKSSAIGGDIPFLQSSAVYVNDGNLMGYSNQFINDTDIPVESANPYSMPTVDVIQDDPSLPSNTLNIDKEAVSSIKSSALDIVGEANNFMSDLVNKGENALNDTLDKVLSSTKSVFEEASEAVDSITDRLKLATDRTEELASNKLTAISTGLKDIYSKLGINAVEGLRRTIVIVEDYLAKGFTSAASSYGSLKMLLPSEIQNTLNVSENKLAEFSRPVGSAFQQGYIALLELEKNLGLDPNDPIIPFFLFVGVSATLWGWYWIFNYSGYMGDLSARSTLELLTGNEDGVLIDLRPEVLRERDGIPDLRRAARYRYVNVVLPEVSSNLRNLLNVGRNLDDSLIAGVIRNLKIVQDKSKVIVMDANGVRSKGVARAMRKLGVKNSYLLQGGFQSWVKEGLRVKELRPETAFTILNEDAEAIIEDLNPTPLRLLGFGMGAIAISYAALEWEKTLQLIGIIGLSQSIYRRAASYKNVEDFKQDTRLLLAPVKLGGEAISWVAGKLDANRNGLPTSPSSSDVQSRVMQAAAKHESQPSDTEQIEDMVLGRTFEDMCAQMYYRGKMFGFVHLYNGQEAVSTGFIKLLKKEDCVVSTYRDHVHALSKGVPAREVMSELFGKTTGCCRGQGGSMHMFSKEHNLLGGFAFIGEGIPVATGAAFTSKYRREVLNEADCDHVTLAFFGDGTCNNGQFFECLNMAALWKLPIIFVVENNLWAIGMSHLRATSDPQIWKKGPAFGMPGVHVDGMDVLKVREVAKEAIGRARRGEGPTLVECETYRFRGHSLADPDELRDPAEKAHYAARDPISALKKYMLENNLATEAELKVIDKKIDELVEDAVKFADESLLPSRSQLLENVFADPRGFGIGPDGRYRCEDPKFTEGTAQV